MTSNQEGAAAWATTQVLSNTKGIAMRSFLAACLTSRFRCVRETWIVQIKILVLTNHRRNNNAVAAFLITKIFYRPLLKKKKMRPRYQRISKLPRRPRTTAYLDSRLRLTVRGQLLTWSKNMMPILKSTLEAMIAVRMRLISSITPKLQRAALIFHQNLTTMVSRHRNTTNSADAEVDFRINSVETKARQLSR